MTVLLDESFQIDLVTAIKHVQILSVILIVQFEESTQHATPHLRKA